MLSRQVLILLFAFAHVEAGKIRWPFYTTRGGVVLNSTVGTPGQFVQLQLGARESFDSDLEIPSTNSPGGSFNPNASSTFQKTGDNNDPALGYVGWFGTDTFVIGDGVVEKSEPFSVYDYPDWSEGPYGSLGLGRPDPGSKEVSFIQAIVNTLDEPIVVFTYDQIPYKYEDPVAGTLTLGGKPEDCSTQWTRVKEHVFDIESFEQWAVEIDYLKVGKYGFKDPGQALISFTNSGFDLPESTYSQIVDGVKTNVDGTIDCNTNATITFTIGGLDIVLTGKDFLYESDEQPGTCYFSGLESFGDDNYNLPVSVLKDRCLLLDYQTLEVGFADRIKN